MLLRVLFCWVIAVGLVPVGFGGPETPAVGALDPLALLPAPPVAGTVEARDDLENAYRTHHAATAAELAAGKAESRLTLHDFTGDIVPWFQPAAAPKTEALFRHAEVETRRITERAKNHWQRPRPYHADPMRFVDAIEQDRSVSYSYPSGHATRGTVFATILGELWPEHRAEFWAKGRDAGWLRVKGGVHYPSDVYAGRMLGQAIARALLADGGLLGELAAAKAELAALAPGEPALAR